MCLIGLAWRADPRWPLILIGNRDELHKRPADPAGWWPDAPDVVGGRDPVTGGGWLAAHRNGRTAAVINLLSPDRSSAAPRARGQLVREWVTGTEPAGSFLERLLREARQYRGFCLLIGDDEAWYSATSTVDQPPAAWPLQPGITAFSNGAPGVRWPKLAWLETEMARLIEGGDVTPEALLATLAFREVPDLPGTDAGGLRVSRQPFVVGDHYGTRASTVLLRKADGSGALTEQSFDATGYGIGAVKCRLGQI